MVFLIQIKEKKMKKNFLKVAALLIAAMLLVVSCSQEVKTPENEDNGLVAVTLNTSVASKGLTFEGLESVENVEYTYTLDALWNDNGLDEKIVGEKNDVTISNINNSIDLGYLSQGYWKIIVKGTHKVTNKVVLYGETNQYITKDKGAVTVFLNVNGDNDNTTGSILTFNIDVNDLAAGNNGYTLHYTIDGANYKGTALTTKSGDISKFSNENNITKFKGSTPDNDKLQPGYYRVTVTLKNGESVIGAITRGFLLIDGDEEVTIKGSVSASDFEESTLQVFTAKVSIDNVTAKVKDTTTDLLPRTASAAGLYAGSVTCDNDDNTVTVVYSLTPSINIEQGTNGVTEVSAPKYTWMVNGVDQNNDSSTLEIGYTPGNRYVTCIVTYTYKFKVGESTGEFAVSNEAYTYLQVNEYSGS